MRNDRTIEYVLSVLLLHALLIFRPASASEGESAPHVHQHDEHSGHMQTTKSDTMNVSLRSQPERITAGSPATLHFSVKDSSGEPARGLTISHDRILHVVIISEDMSTFSHIHPEDFAVITEEMLNSAQFMVRYTFPKAGRYLVAADTAVGSRHLSEHFIIGVTGDPHMGKLRKDLSREKKFGDYNAALSTLPEHIIAGKGTTLRFDIKRNSTPVTDLEPYLAAPMHIAVVSAEISEFIHAHGEVAGPHAGHHPMGHVHGDVPGSFGPSIEANVIFPVKGTYQIFGEVKHQGKVIVLSFMVEVE